MDKQREKFEQWWEEYKAAQDEWQFADRDAILFQAWQAALASQDAEPVALLNLHKREVEWDVENIDPLWVGVGLLTPVFTTPPLTKAAVAAAIEKAAKVCDVARDGYDEPPSGWDRSDPTHAEYFGYQDACDELSEKIRALQTEDGLEALREFGMKVAEKVVNAVSYNRIDGLSLDESPAIIVNRVMKGE